MGGLPLASGRKGLNSAVAPPADTSQHCIDPERGIQAQGGAGPRERNTITSQIRYLRKVGTDKGAHVFGFLRQGRKVSWIIPAVRF